MIQYDPHNWLDHLFDVRGSLVREISLRVASCVVFAALVAYIHLYQYKIGIPSLLHALTGPVLGLLLVFRNNSSYDRFWEGRKLWGGIINESRNLIRSAAVLLADDRALLHRLTKFAAVFPAAAINALRGTPLGPLALTIPPDAREQIESSQHPALAVALRMTQCLDEARRKGLVSDILFHSLDQNVQQLVDYLGGCERIRRTPLPFAYMVHVRRAIILYCLTLPFALVEAFGWSSVIDVALISYLMLGIEEIGVEIEGPFGDDDNDLPLEDYCETIHRNLYALAGVDRQERDALEEG